ncbi:UNVERIFIED_ORG: ABC-type uncharacterized transport system permease subunit [Arthrobacter sp. UYCu721]
MPDSSSGSSKEHVSDPTLASRWQHALVKATNGSVGISLLSVLLALIVSGILIAATNSEVEQSASYLFGRPADFLMAVWSAISGAVIALVRGSIYNDLQPDVFLALRPLAQTLAFATPLLVAGLGVGIAFRVGLFNIGGQGQLLVGAACAGWVGWAFPLPPLLHLPLALLAGLVGGAVWAGIAGVLKARTGAHEVISTIMLNWIAFYLISYLLRTPGALQAHGSNDPRSPATLPSATFPALNINDLVLSSSIVVAVLLTVGAWVFLERSSIGFRFRTVGFNPNAAKVAGISANTVTIAAFLVAGGLVGIAGAFQVTATVTTGFGSSIDAGIGFDAITVALLGRSRPFGILAASLLFGALKAGGFAMQATQGVPVDIVLVVQSLIVFFIAAPPLVRAIFRVPLPLSTKAEPVPSVAANGVL